MKTSTFFKAGLLLFAAGIVLTGCGKDDKDPEIVVDPVEETVEYLPRKEMHEKNNRILHCR